MESDEFLAEEGARVANWLDGLQFRGLCLPEGLTVDQDRGRACINALFAVASVEWTSAERPAFAKPLSAPSTQSCRPRTHAQLGIPHTPLECLVFQGLPYYR